MRAKSLFCAFPIYRITNPTNGLKTTRCHIYIWAHIFLKVHLFTYFKLTTLSQCRSLSSLFFLIVSLPHSPSSTPHLGSSSSYSTSSVSFPPSSPPPLYTSALYLSCSSSTCLSLVHTLSLMLDAAGDRSQRFPLLLNENRTLLPQIRTKEKKMRCRQMGKNKIKSQVTLWKQDK